MVAMSPCCFPLALPFPFVALQRQAMAAGGDGSHCLWYTYMDGRRVLGGGEIGVTLVTQGREERNTA
jgi:hypothetical protein